MAIKTELAEINGAHQRAHTAKVEEFRSFAYELRRSVEQGEDILQRGISPEILQAGHAVFEHCEELLNDQEIQIYKPRRVTYRTNREVVNDRRHMVPGQLVEVHTDPLQSLAEGKGLETAELGAETCFTVTTRDPEGNQLYDKDQVIVKVYSPTGENENKNVEDSGDGKYTVRYKPKTVGYHQIAVEVNGKPLNGSPWNVQATPHNYEARYSFGSRGKGRAEFDKPCSIAVSERSGNIAIADCANNQVHLFDSGWRYLGAIGNKIGGAIRLGKPSSVAFAASGNIVVLHRQVPKAHRMSIFTEHGKFIKGISESLADPCRVSITSDGRMIVCDRGDKSLKVLSSDGTKLLQSLNDPKCTGTPWFAVQHQGMFLASYGGDDCVVKVFNKEGRFLYNIGSAHAQLRLPRGMAIDKFNNLVVCDSYNSKLQIFTLDGKFLGSVNEEMEHPLSVAVSMRAELLVCDLEARCIHVYQ